MLANHVTLEVEGIDRMYLNVYVPGLHREQGVACFFRFHRGNQFVSSALMDPISKTYIAAVEAFARQEKIPIITFRKGQRKDDVAVEQRKKFQKSEGVVFIAKGKRRHRCSEQSDAAMKRPAARIPGLSAPPPWSIITISTAWIVTTRSPHAGVRSSVVRGLTGRYARLLPETRRS